MGSFHQRVSFLNMRPHKTLWTTPLHPPHPELWLQPHSRASETGRTSCSCCLTDSEVQDWRTRLQGRSCEARTVHNTDLLRRFNRDWETGHCPKLAAYTSAPRRAGLRPAFPAWQILYAGTLYWGHCHTTPNISSDLWSVQYNWIVLSSEKFCGWPPTVTQLRAKMMKCSLFYGMCYGIITVQ